LSHITLQVEYCTLLGAYHSALKSKPTTGTGLRTVLYYTSTTSTGVVLPNALSKPPTVLYYAQQ